MATTRSINLSDEKKRDAVVALVFPEKPEEVTSKLPGGEAPRSIRFLKETVATNLTSLTGEFKDDDGVGKAIIAEDPEIDLETKVL